MRTLDDIVPPSRRKETFPQQAENNINNNGSVRDFRPRSQFPYVTFLIVSFIIAASTGALFYFSSAKVEITPSTVSTAVQNSFVANKSTGELPFEIITEQKTATQSIAGNGTKMVKSAASGNITIYNTQSVAQKLITNTRFATASGLIFRIHSAVTIPAGTAAKPGSVVAKVYADQEGDSYNVGATSFTIPGFAGKPQETKVYARSTSPMTGGASGMVPIVDVSTETQARSALKKALEEDLMTSIKAKVPEGYVLLSGASAINYQDIPLASSATTGQVDVKEQGTITAIVFPSSALANAIASSVTALDYKGEPLSLTSTNELVLNSSALPSVNETSFSFTLSGTTQLIYTVDSSRIAAAVAGETRSSAEVALTNYPEVKRAVIVLRPFWRQSFPEDPSSISVVVAEVDGK